MPAVQSLGGIVAALVISGLLVLAVSPDSIRVAGLPAFLWCAVLAFAIQWLAFIPAFVAQTEHFFDLTGSLTYIGLVVFAAWLGGDGRSLLLLLLVGCWALRLGSFLFLRVREAGSDRRFNSIKPDFLQFLMTWTLQGLWVFITLSAALAAMTSAVSVPLGGLALLGALIWTAGFTIEVIADQQKRAFRKEQSNRDRFIDIGLWAWSRHPNYFGEILLWCGIAVIALPALAGWQLLTLLSPVFVYLLLTRISGIRMLEARARRRWGDDPDYQDYLSRTPRLIPKPPAAAG